MSSGKKGKKSKGKTLALTDFLADTPGGIPPIPLKVSSWADDIEDDHEGGFSSSRNKEPVLPTAPRAARDPGFDEENIPNSPPYVAYISNLPYDVDEEDLAEFFADMKVSNMRLPKDSNKLRGYGYVEFEDRQSLIDALSITNTTIKTRRVRIEVSNSSNDERRGGRMMGRDNRRDDYGDPERTTGDWRSGPRDEPTSEDRYRSRGGDRRDDREGSEIDNKPGGWREGGEGGGAFKDRSSGFRDDDRPRYGGDRDSRDRDGDRDRERSDIDNKPGGWREGGDRGGAFRDRGGFRDDDRERDRPRYGGDRDNRDRDGDRERSDIDNKPGGWREGGDRGGAFRDRGGFRDDDRERDRPRYGGDRDSRDRDGDRGGSFGPRRNYGDSDWGRASSDGPPRRDEPSSESKTRPKLQLQPRSKPVEPVAVAEELPEPGPAAAPAPAPAPVPSVNIFGQAKPVDTTAREREIEERLAKSFAEVKSRDEGDPERRSMKDAVKVRSNGDGRVEKDRGRPAWRTDEDRGREHEKPGSRPPTSRSGQRGDSRGPPTSQVAPARVPQKSADIRGPQDRERKERYKDDDDDISRMPKAKAEQTPNFIASNKYSILPDDVDPDNTDD